MCPRILSHQPDFIIPLGPKLALANWPARTKFGPLVKYWKLGSFILKIGTGTTFLETRRCAAATMATAYLANDPM